MGENGSEMPSVRLGPELFFLKKIHFYTFGNFFLTDLPFWVLDLGSGLVFFEFTLPGWGRAQPGDPIGGSTSSFIPSQPIFLRLEVGSAPPAQVTPWPDPAKQPPGRYPLTEVDSPAITKGDRAILQRGIQRLTQDKSRTDARDRATQVLSVCPTPLSDPGGWGQPDPAKMPALFRISFEVS